jgi:hypothetical protein
MSCPWNRKQEEHLLTREIANGARTSSFHGLAVAEQFPIDIYTFALLDK